MLIFFCLIGIWSAGSMFICPLWIEMIQSMFLISYYDKKKFVMLQEKFRHKHTKIISGFTTKITMFLKNWNLKIYKHVITVFQCSYTWMLIMKSSVFVREVSGIWQVHIAAVCILDHIFAIIPWKINCNSIFAKYGKLS